MAPSCDMGVFGMGTMGQNLALNAADNGFRVAAYNRPDEFQARIWGALDRAKSEGRKGGGEMLIDAFTELPPFVASLKRPRCVLLSIPSGAPVDGALAALTPLLSAGDVVIDGGNEQWAATERRSEQLLAQSGIHHVGMGISGGSEGARHGPSLMPGCSEEAWGAIRPFVEKMAAVANGSACVTHVGPGGAGHYVKMVHNGVEYADMQLLAEAYDLLKSVCGLTNPEMAAAFERWQGGELECYLVEITAKILRKEDALEGGGGGFLLDKVLDQAGSKGTGKWTVQAAADLGAAAPAISAALDGRFVSAARADRAACEELYGGLLEGAELPRAERLALVEQVGEALYAAKVVAYAQGFSVLTAASKENGWGLRLAELARIWRGGCIIRAALLDDIVAAFTTRPDLPNLLLDPALARAVAKRSHALRAVCSASARAGVPAPAFAASLAYFDGMRRARGPANLIQAQRDCFGAHTYKRVDTPGTFQTPDWAA